MIDSRQLSIERLIWCAPLKAGQGCPIVKVGGVSSRELPPAVWQASQMAHSLSFVHESGHKALGAAILLRYVGGRVENLNALPLEQVIIGDGFVFTTKI